MADTIQIVSWALEFTCPLRSAENSADPVRSLSEIARARTISDALGKPSSEFGIFGDICVTSCMWMRVPKQLAPARADSSSRNPNSALGWLFKRSKEQDSDMI